MRAIKFNEFKSVVGQGYITMKTHNFPKQGWCWKTIDNVIYVWAKPCTPLKEVAKLERVSGKEVKLCLVPKEIVKHTGI